MGTKVVTDSRDATVSVAHIVTLDDPKGAATFNKLSDEAKNHLRLFGLSRPGFDLAIMDPAFDVESLGELTRQPGRILRQAPLHWYQAGTLYMISHLKGMERTPEKHLKVIDIGSPIEQQLAICALDNVDVSVIDIRPRWYPDILPFTSITGDAVKLPVSDALVDVVTSNCVLCHVGDGRYGDALDVDADVKMLRECKRILRPGGLLLLGLGPMWTKAHILFNHHRVYSEAWARKLFQWAGLRVQDLMVYNVERGQWHTPDLMSEKGRKMVTTYYGFARLERPA